MPHLRPPARPWRPSSANSDDESVDLYDPSAPPRHVPNYLSRQINRIAVPEAFTITKRLAKEYEARGGTPYQQIPRQVRWKLGVNYKGHMVPPISSVVRRYTVLPRPRRPIRRIAEDETSDSSSSDTPPPPPPPQAPPQPSASSSSSVYDDIPPSPPQEVIMAPTSPQPEESEESDREYPNAAGIPRFTQYGDFENWLTSDIEEPLAPSIDLVTRRNLFDNLMLSLALDPDSPESYYAQMAFAKVNGQLPTRIYLRHNLNNNIREFTITPYRFRADPFQFLPTAYYPRQTRQLGMADFPILLDNVFRDPVGNFAPVTFKLNIFRSRPSWRVWEARIDLESPARLPWTNLYSYDVVRVLLELTWFHNIIARGISLTEIMSSQSIIRYWFQARLTIITQDLLEEDLTITSDLLSLAAPLLIPEGEHHWILKMQAALIGWVNKVDTAAPNTVGSDIQHLQALGHTSNLKSLSIFFYIPAEAGGCRDFFNGKYISRKLRNSVYDPISQYNNCLFACFEKSLGQEGTIEDARELTNNMPGTMIDIAGVKGIAEYYECNYFLYTIVREEATGIKVFQLTAHAAKDNRPDVRLILNRGHYSLIQNPRVLEWSCCPSCYEWFKDLSKHMIKCKKCGLCGLKQTPNHTCRQSRAKRQKRKPVKKLTDKELAPPDLSKLYIADFETFMYNGEMVVYAAAIGQLNTVMEQEAVQIFYGKNSLDYFMDYLKTIQGTIVFYNGSRFDYYFIFKWMILNKQKIKSFNKDTKGNKITSFEIWRVSFWDLVLFTNCSLANLCKSMKIPDKLWKKQFDHHLVSSWTTADDHRAEVSHYLKYDIISLAHCFSVFTSTMERLYKIHPLNCQTLASYAYDVWRTFYINIEYLNRLKISTLDEYRYFHERALFGGRCAPQRKIFTSISSIPRPYLLSMSADTRKQYFDSIQDYLVLVDVNSLYPFVSTWEYPIGEPVWEDNPNRFIALLNNVILNNKLIRCSYVEVDVICPKNILTPFLFARNQHGELVADLIDKEKQVYDGETILEAMILGYRFTTCHSWLRYPDLGKVLESYMTHCIGEKGKFGKDDVEYFVHKSMGNSNTGKFNQHTPNRSQHISSDDTPLDHLGDSVKKIEAYLNREQTTMGFYYELEKDEKPSKPANIGVSILANSRVLMSQYTRAFNGYSDEHLMSLYGDTDSMLIHKDALDIPGINIFGNEWGKLKPEFGAAKIISAYLVAPKTYALEYLDPHPEKGFTVKWHIRAKGIPRSVIVSAEDEYLKYTPMAPRMSSDLNEVLYTTYERDGSYVETYPCLRIDHFDDMVNKDRFIEVHYSSMNKFLRGKGRTPYIEMDHTKRRTINYNDWWKKEKRVLRANGVSYPVGFQL